MEDSDEKKRITETMRHFFQLRPLDVGDDDGDDTKLLDCWEFADPTQIKSWTLQWAPHCDYMTFSKTFVGGVDDPIVIDFSVKVTEFDYDNDVLKLICTTKHQHPYDFTIAVDIVRTPFEVHDMMDSLKPSTYDEIKSTLDSDYRNGHWLTKNRGALRAKPLSFKLRNLVVGLDAVAKLAQAKVKQRRPALEGSGLTATGSQPGSRTTTSVQPAIPRAEGTGGSHGSPASSAQGRKRAPKKGAEPAQKKSKLVSEEDLATSMAGALESIPRVVDKVEDINWNNTNLIYQKFFSDCQDAFVFEDKPQKKIEIDTCQMKNAPVDWTIRAFESRGETFVLNLLINMSDRSNKQTLCVMPDLPQKPTSEEEMSTCEFWIINGQHSVAASKKIIENPACRETMKKDFRTWNAFVVWSKDVDKLRKISAFYNRVNHFTPFKPTWATNIIAACTVWEKYGSPPNRHAAAGVADTRTKKKAGRQSAQTMGCKDLHHTFSQFSSTRAKLQLT